LAATILIFFLENKLTKLTNLVQFKRMLMSCLEDWGLSPGPLVYFTKYQKIYNICRLIYITLKQKRR